MKTLLIPTALALLAGIAAAAPATYAIDPTHTYPSFEAPSVDKVMVEERAAGLGKRSIKKSAKDAGLKLAVAMMDLTTLEGKDSAGKVRQMCQKARWPHERTDIPSCAAVCVYPKWVRTAKEALAGSTVKVASVATAFPSGLSPLSVKLDDVPFLYDGFRAAQASAPVLYMLSERFAHMELVTSGRVLPLLLHGLK